MFHTHQLQAINIISHHDINNATTTTQQRYDIDSTMQHHWLNMQYACGTISSQICHNWTCQAITPLIVVPNKAIVVPYFSGQHFVCICTWHYNVTLTTTTQHWQHNETATITPLSYNIIVNIIIITTHHHHVHHHRLTSLSSQNIIIIYIIMFNIIITTHHRFIQHVLHFKTTQIHN